MVKGRLKKRQIISVWKDHQKMIVEQEVPVQKCNQVKLGLHLHCWPRQKNSAQVKVQGAKKAVSVDPEFSCFISDR